MKRWAKTLVALALVLVASQAYAVVGDSTVGSTQIVGRDGSKLRITQNGYAAVSLESLEFMDTIDGASINSNLWTTSTSTMTVASYMTAFPML